MKRFTALLLTLLMLLGALGGPAALAEELAQTEEGQEPTEAAFSMEETRKAIDAWQQEPCSFTMRASFLSLENWGLEEKIDQECGKDGSFRFFLSFHSWDHDQNWETEDATEYHYEPEGEDLLCTTRHFLGSSMIPDGPIQRYQMGEREQKELFASWQQMLGCAAMLPDWVEELSAEDVPGSPELLCLRYRLPMERVLQEEGMLKQLLSNLFLLREIEEPPKGLMIDGELYLQRDSLRPDRLRYSFDELAAEIFAEGDHQSGAAEDTARMEVEYRLDHELAETVPLPETLKETEGQETVVRGAESLEALNALFDGEELFTPEQVRCMGYEMLLACLTACDEEKSLELLADFDPERVAAYLNENFFTAVKLEKFRYEIGKQFGFPIPEEVTQQTLAWFESQKDGVIAQYGEENYRQIHEETAGQQEYTFSDYTMRFADGSEKQDGFSRGNQNGLILVKSNGRYFWNAFDLFESLTEEEMMIPSPLRGTVEDGYYIPAELGLRVRVEDWRVGSRKELSQILYGDASYAYAMPEELLANGLPYGDLMIQKDNTTVFFLLVLLPVKNGDGIEAEDLKAYMDSSEKNLLQTFTRGGMKLISMDREELELGGRHYEMIRLHANGGIDQFFTLLATEEKGKLYVVNINGLGSDDTDELLSRFEALPEGEEG